MVTSPTESSAFAPNRAIDSILPPGEPRRTNAVSAFISAWSKRTRPSVPKRRRSCIPGRSTSMARPSLAGNSEMDTDWPSAAGTSTLMMSRRPVPRLKTRPYGACSRLPYAGETQSSPQSSVTTSPRTAKNSRRRPEAHGDCIQALVGDTGLTDEPRAVWKWAIDSWLPAVRTVSMMIHYWPRTNSTSRR